MQPARPARRRGAAALAAAAALLIAPLAACAPTVWEPATVTVGDVELLLDVPEGSEIGENVYDASECVTAEAVIQPGGTGKGHVWIQTVAPESACPGEPTMNRAASWGSLDQLPSDASPRDLDLGVDATVHEFTTTFTVCTNHCESSDWPVTFVELADGRTFFVTSSSVPTGDVTRMIESLTVVS